MPKFQAESENFVDLLKRIQDGDEICLKPGEYSGPFTIERAIKIYGTGIDTVIFAVDEPALVIKVSGVRLENLVIERTVGGDMGETVLLASPGTSPILNKVRLHGVAENVQWEGASWDIPAELDLKEVETDIQAQSSLLLEIGSLCQVNSEIEWLQVKPNYLSPGPQRLDIILNSRGIPPGTRLSGSITLESVDRNRVIFVTTTIIAPQITTLPLLPTEPLRREETSAEKWGYKFVGRTIDQFIQEIEGKEALQINQDFSARRNCAEDLMFELVGNKPCLFYVRRKGQRNEQGEEKWELTIATDVENTELPDLLVQRRKTLVLVAVVSQGGSEGLRLISAQLRPPERGQTDGFAVPFYLRLLSNYKYRIGLPQTTFLRMAAIPIPRDVVPTEDQLQAWKAFLNVEERLAQARQFCVPFVSHNYGDATRNITFIIDINSATVDGSSENSLEPNEFCQRAKKAINSDIKIIEDTSTIVKGNREGRELGTIESFEYENNKIKIRLDAEICDLMAEGLYRLPNTALLSFISFGDIIQIERKKRALKDLEDGRSQNPFLGRFLFDVSQARLPEQEVILHQQDLLLKTANKNQKLAVETVLAVPDLALIQGPPGTGKTTVIAEICYQVALRGGRTLIASQANLAVDNALSRLKHNPAIRVIRKGNQNSVGPEGEPFLENQVISTWLKNTSSDCEKRLFQQLETVKIFRELLAQSERFAAYLIIERSFEYEQKKLQEQKENLEFNYQKKINSLELEVTKYKQVESLLAGLKNLLASMPIVNWTKPAVIDLLEDLQSYIEKDISAPKLAEKVHPIVNLMAKIGLVSPKFKILKQVVWLQDNLPLMLTEFEGVFTDARNTVVKAISEVESSHHIFEKYSISLAKIHNITQCNSNINNLVLNYRQWDQAQSVACELNNLISPVLDILPSKKLPSERAVFHEIEKLKIDGLDSVTTLPELRDLAFQKLYILIKPLNFLDKFIEWFLAIVTLLNLGQPSRRIKALVCLEAIRRLVLTICQNSSSELLYLIDELEQDTNELKKLIPSLNPSSIFSNIANQIEKDLTKFKITAEGTILKAKKLESEICETKSQLEQNQNKISIERSWWQEYWEAIPSHFKPAIPPTGLFDLDLLHTVEAQFDAWQKELAIAEAYLCRYQNILSDWIGKLRNPSEQDHNELRRIYLDNANVIGITCSQSASGEFSKEFKSFDVVIIDEVSKCTPPELIIPALKAKKLVLVGDHRQLPPMLNSESLEEIAEELGTTQEELSYLEESLFKSQFELANESIKKMLTIQYRMHPSIMGAINQFYENKLECGLFKADQDRAHNLNGELIKEHHHLIFVKTPIEQGFYERKDGTSYVNLKEIEIITKLCEQMENAWYPKVEQGNLRKEIGIITFYGRQLKLIEDRINPQRYPSLHIRTGTVDRFQGMERQVVFVSMVRNNNQRQVGFAKKPERVNVAFSRAQELLVIVGCHSLFTQQHGKVGSMYSNISNVVRLHGGFIDVSDILC